MVLVAVCLIGGTFLTGRKKKKEKTLNVDGGGRGVGGGQDVTHEVGATPLLVSRLAASERAHVLAVRLKLRASSSPWSWIATSKRIDFVQRLS